MKHLKHFENSSDRILTYYKRYNIYKDKYVDMVKVVDFLKSNHIDYEICKKVVNDYFGDTKYILYAFVKIGDFIKRNLLDDKYFLLDDSINIHSEKIRDINKIKTFIGGDAWVIINKDEFDEMIDTIKYNL